MKTIRIGRHCIGTGSPPFIIAELSGNHGQDKQLALDMIKAASLAGAHAIKLQTYTPDSMTLDVKKNEFVIQESDSLWAGESLYDLYAKAATPYEWHEQLFSYARELGLEAFSSPFDPEAVDFLDSLDVPCFKIASFELTDLPLIAKAAEKRKPLIMSTGMATLREIEEAVNCAKDNGCDDIILLKCTSTYPAQADNTNLQTIPHMQQTFNCSVGLSDHTRGIGVAVAAVAMGACVVEKHFVLDRSAGGVDAEFSLEPSELANLTEETQRAHQALGRITYGGSLSEVKSKQYRRSIYVSKTVKAGEILNEDNLKIIRPAFGLAPRHWQKVVGKYAAVDLEMGTALDWSHVK